MLRFIFVRAGQLDGISIAAEKVPVNAIFRNPGDSAVLAMFAMSFCFSYLRCLP
jgi:hypothetical protein